MLLLDLNNPKLIYRNQILVVIYDKRSNERSYPQRYRSLLEPHLRPILVGFWGKGKGEKGKKKPLTLTL